MNCIGRQYQTEALSFFVKNVHDYLYRTVFVLLLFFRERSMRGEGGVQTCRPRLGCIEKYFNDDGSSFHQFLLTPPPPHPTLAESVSIFSTTSRYAPIWLIPPHQGRSQSLMLGGGGEHMSCNWSTSWEGPKQVQLILELGGARVPPPPPWLRACSTRPLFSPSSYSLRLSLSLFLPSPERKLPVAVKWKYIVTLINSLMTLLTHESQTIQDCLYAHALIYDFFFIIEQWQTEERRGIFRASWQ